MTTVQKFKKSILFVVLYVVICDMTESTLPAFHCDSAGNVVLEKQDDVDKTEIIQSDGVLCQPTQVQLSTDCPQADNQIKIVFGALKKSAQNKDQILGGQNSEYGILTCEDKAVTAVAHAQPLVVSPGTIPEKTKAIPFAISLSITGQTTHLLGEKLTLSLEGPDATHFVQPIECTAKPAGPADTNRHTIWELHYNNGDCHNEPSVIIPKWTTVQPTGNQPKKLTIDMYAFRFATSSSVTIECSAFVCPKKTANGDCKETCIDTTRRRRGAIHGMQTFPKSNNTSSKIMVASTSFEVQLGDQNTGNSAERLSKNVQLYSLASIFVLMVTMMIR